MRRVGVYEESGCVEMWVYDEGVVCQRLLV